MRFSGRRQTFTAALACAADADLDGDTDVDLADLAEFQQVFGMP